MGSVSSNPGGEELGTLGNIPQNLRKMELKIDFTKEEHPALKQLLYWSLADIRTVYEKFQRRSRGKVAFLDKTLFCKIVPFTRTNAIFIFENFSRNNKYLSVYEFLCVLTIASYTHYINKIHFLYILFDLDCNGGISLNELLIIFKSIVMGYCKLTQSSLPAYQNLEKFAKLMFLKSDIQADNALELKEIIEWVDQNQTAKELFLRYEPQYSVKENYEIFRYFAKYTEEDAEEMLKQINKANKDEYFYNDLGRLMGGKFGQASYLNKTKNQKKGDVKLPKINQKGEELDELEELEDEINNEQIDKALDQHAKKYETKKQVIKKEEIKQLQINKNLQQNISGGRSRVFLRDMNKTFSHKVSKNIIIIKGDTLTKQEVFKLKEYFDLLSDKNNEISIKEFTKAFQKKEHMKRVCPSLFNFLDDKSTGKVTFNELIMKLYPSLYQNPNSKNVNPKVQSDLKLINSWIRSYNKTFSQDQKETITQNQNQQDEPKAPKRKRVLPSSSMIRIKEIFGLLDDEDKGYLTAQDLQKHFSYGFTQKEIDILVKQNNEKGDGKVTLKDFIGIILPQDYIIEEKEGENQN